MESSSFHADITNLTTNVHETTEDPALSWLPTSSRSSSQAFIAAQSFNTTANHQERYRMRNAVLGASGIALNLLAVPVICQHQDLTLFLRALFCCMTTDNMLIMASSFMAGLLPVDDQYNANIRWLTKAVYLAGNVNCLVVVVIAAERVLALYQPVQFKRLGNIGKTKAVLAVLWLWAAGVLLTLPVHVYGDPDPRATTPLAILTEFGVAAEAAIFVSTSLVVCVTYVCLAVSLYRRGHPPPVKRSLAWSASTNSFISTSYLSNTSFVTRSNPNNNNNASASNAATTDQSTTTTSVSTSTSTTTTAARTSQQLRRLTCATVHCAVLAVWFFLAYAPFGCYYFLLLLTGADRKAEQNTLRITVISSFPLLNSLVDPLLVCARLLRPRDAGR